MSIKEVSYKKFTEEDWYSIEGMLAGGAAKNEIAHSFNITVEVLNKSISKFKNGKHRWDEALRRVESKSVLNLRRIADGYTLFEREYIARVGDYKILDMYRTALIDALEKKDYDSFLKFLMQTASEKDAYDIRHKEKQYAPDRATNLSILKAINPDLWDEELRRKKVPQVKINVTVDSVDMIEAPRRKIKPNYEVVNE